MRDRAYKDTFFAPHLAILFLLAASARGGDDLTHFGFDEAAYTSEGAEGLKEIFSGRCFHGALPLRVLGRLNSSSNIPSFAVFMPSPPQRRLGLAPDLPAQANVFARRGVLLANGNCFACHAGVVHGQVVAGLGNNRTDQVAEHLRFLSVTSKIDQVESELKNAVERKELADFLDHARASGSVYRFAKTLGDNFGPYAVWKLGARLVDPASRGITFQSEKTDLEKFVDDLELPTVDPMPWWLMKYKTKDYWYADAAPNDAVHFSLNFTTAHPEANENRAQHIASVAKALAFARETVSPPYPHPLDPERVARGADLFHGRTKPTNKTGFISCKNCHGTYTRRASLADPTKPGSWDVAYPHSETLRDVKTDTAYNDVLRKLAPVADHIMKLHTYFAAQGQPELAPNVSVPTRAGYIAPPLVGIWASAPYFHNGSVPSIAAVLHSKERPKLWARSADYDFENVGLRHKVWTQEEIAQVAAQPGAVDDRSVYDTTLFGRSNAGHTFGDNLTTDERKDIIEFLKSLSGPDM